MKCDQCEYIFKFDGSEAVIQRQGSFGQPILFCSKKCKCEYDKEDEELSKESE